MTRKTKGIQSACRGAAARAPGMRCNDSYESVYLLVVLPSLSMFTGSSFKHGRAESSAERAGQGMPANWGKCMQAWLELRSTRSGWLRPPTWTGGSAQSSFSPELLPTASSLPECLDSAVKLAPARFSKRAGGRDRHHVSENPRGSAWHCGPGWRSPQGGTAAKGPAPPPNNDAPTHQERCALRGAPRQPHGSTHSTGMCQGRRNTAEGIRRTIRTEKTERGARGSVNRIHTGLLRRSSPTQT